MPAITWTDQLSVGVHAIDSDHRLLVSLINQLEDAVAAGQGRETVGSVLNALVDYTDYHFAREEALMLACGYQGLEKHKGTHAELAAKVADIRDLYLSNPSMVLERDLMEFLTSWLTVHIMGHDRDYMPSMRGKEKVIEEANRQFAEGFSLTQGEADDPQDFIFA